MIGVVFFRGFWGFGRGVKRDWVLYCLVLGRDGGGCKEGSWRRLIWWEWWVGRIGWVRK